MTCSSCSDLALKFLRIVLDIPEGVWYSTNCLSGDAGFEIETMAQLEFSWGASTPFDVAEGLPER